MRIAYVAAVLVIVASVAGCARFQSKPLSAAAGADAFHGRALTDPGLREFLETNALGGAWSRENWDLNALTLAAFYFHPDMDMARARWHAATAGKITAAQRPNPSLAFTPRLNSTSIGTGMTPWILGGVLDIPVETMGKRKYRVAQAQHLDEMARFELANTAWTIRSRVRSSMLILQSATESEAILREQADTLERLARLVEVQWKAGALSPVEVSAARVAHHNAQLNFKDAQRQGADARGQLAEAIGVPLKALDNVKISFSDLAEYPAQLAVPDVQRQAMLNRADVLSALAEYAASESSLQVQIARQYPDIHLRPGYELDQTKNKWQLGVSFDLPILNQNQGPIAEAEARREEVAAKFNAVQAKAIGEIERATAVYSAAVEQAGTADNLLDQLQSRSTAMERMYEAGEVDRLAVTTTLAEVLNGKLSRLKSRVQAQSALAALEHAVQAPLLMPIKPAQMEISARPSSPSQNP